MKDSTGYRHPYPLFERERMRGRDGKPFLADDDLLAAANVALALGRPLLLTGEPGCGKTDFAFAAATSLLEDRREGTEHRRPLEQYIRSETRARDLLYHYDAVRRFGDAQAGGEPGRRRAAFPQNYVSLEPLGQALVSPVRKIVLIDEIDKAPRDLPNDLLRELDQGGFEIPEIPETQNAPAEDIEPRHRGLQRHMLPPSGARKPLVIITSNVERQLPDAFLRRCIFYYIPFPSQERLGEILDSRYPDLPVWLKTNALGLLWELRESFRLTKKPATAELLDWIGVLRTVFDPAAARQPLEDALARLGRGEPVPWRTIPALGCLVKLREDLERLAAPA